MWQQPESFCGFCFFFLSLMYGGPLGDPQPARNILTVGGWFSVVWVEVYLPALQEWK